jgi:hypothetical protein
MAYSEFITLKQAEKKLGVESQVVYLFQKPITPATISAFLANDLAEAKEIPMSSEKAKSEAIIMPVLKEVKRQRKDFNFYSGYTFDVDSNLSLTGVCDYLLTFRPDKEEITAPIFCLVEAKNRTIEEGLGQCVAEMYAAKLFNEQEGENIPYIYGCVTTAYEWRFLKLEDTKVFIDREYYYINQITEILAILLQIFDTAKQSTALSK